MGPFKTAKAIMLEDMRRKGQTYRPQGGASSQESDRAPAAAQAPFRRLGHAKPSQKRTGGFYQLHQPMAGVLALNAA